MADVKIVDIDNEQWNMKDQEARNKINEQSTLITNLATEINGIKSNYKRFYYDANTDRNVELNRIEAMLYCYSNSKSGIATIRYAGGHYYNVIIPASELNIKPMFVEITYFGHINIYQIRSKTDYSLVRNI